MRNEEHSSFIIPHSSLYSVFVISLEFLAVFCFVAAGFVTAVIRLRFCVGIGAVGIILFLVFTHVYDHLSVKEFLQVLVKIYIFSEEKILCWNCRVIFWSKWKKFSVTIINYICS